MSDLLRNPPIESITPDPAIPGLGIDARTGALSALREYISELTFYKPGDGKRIVPFQLPIADIHIEQPDGESDMVYPSIVFETGEAGYDMMGYFDESSKDLFGKGTVLFVHWERKETITIRVNTQYRAERRAILAGIEFACAPTEEICAFRLLCKDYFNQSCGYILKGSRVGDDAQSANNRRSATLTLHVYINVVQLVHYRDMYVVPETRVSDSDDDS